MGLETGTYISDLVATNPVGATDDRATADDHLRLIKAVLQNTFPNINGAVTPTPAELNVLTGAFIKTLLDDTDAISARSTLGLADGPQGYFLRAEASGPEYATPYFAVTAYSTTNISIPNNTYTDLPFTSETHDSGSLHDTASNQELFVAPSWATKMRMTGNIRWEVNATGVRGFRVVTSAGANLTPNHSVLVPAASSSTNISVNISTGLLSVTGGSSYKIQCYQNSGGALNVEGASNSYVTVEFFP